ncbi:AMPKBI-domain-containing protein [Coniochaeta sp. PMI_546]|nr:AMPKBI-domain-containing protein [Coniochaeta sp. PMI_546]
MGNNPSSNSKPASPAPHHSLSIQHRNHQRDGDREHYDSSPRAVPVKREVKHPIPVSHQRTAAPPEPSLAQAQGTTANNSANTNNHNYNSRPKSLQPRPLNNSSSAQPSPAGSLPSPATKPIDTKPRLDTRTGKNEHEPAKPVAVPSSHNSPPSDLRSPYSDTGIESATMPQSSVQDMSYLTRPPRLPLPIDQEIHTPGSPIIAPADLGEPVDPVDDLGDLDADGQSLPRRSSGLSSASDIDKDDDIEELRVHRNRPTVPLTLEWRQGGNKVYVTGTIFQWNRKTKMMPIEGQPGCFTVTCKVLPGTHHIRFLVDGQMLTSPDLPTTVDYGNNLVNYIEISIDDSKETGGKDGQQATSAKPSPLIEGQEKPHRERQVASLDQFSSEIPKYLKDFDEAEDTPLYNNALAAIQKLPSPPSLPGFLGKPILNAATLIKDDSSVLVNPNHTVLNHLATSSIKDNVLAVSATTRYKDKYVTTIIYKPTDAT